MRNISRGRRRTRNSGHSSFSSPSPIRPPDKPTNKKVKLDGSELADENTVYSEGLKESQQEVQSSSESTSNVQQIIVSYESMGDLGIQGRGSEALSGLVSQTTLGSKGVESEAISQGGLPPTKGDKNMQADSSSVDQDSVVSGS